MVQPVSDTAALNERELYCTDIPVGEILRRGRLHYGQSLPDIERSLRIRVSQIEAIEQGAIEKLPGRVYAIGFVRSYAEYLGLDGDKMVHLFKAQYGRKTVNPALDFPVAASETKMPPLWIVGLSLLVVALGAFFWWSSQNAVRESVTEILDVKDVITLGHEQITGEAYGPHIPEGYDPRAKVAKAALAAKPKGVILSITENSWVEIKDKAGKLLVSRVLKAGDQYFVPSRPGLTMSLGNAGGVRLMIDAQALSALGRRGEVRHDIPLDIEYLKKTYTKPSSDNPE